MNQPINVSEYFSKSRSKQALRAILLGSVLSFGLMLPHQGHSASNNEISLERDMKNKYAEFEIAQARYLEQSAYERRRQIKAQTGKATSETIRRRVIKTPEPTVATSSSSAISISQPTISSVGEAQVMQEVVLPAAISSTNNVMPKPVAVSVPAAAPASLPANNKIVNAPLPVASKITEPLFPATLDPQNVAPKIIVPEVESVAVPAVSKDIVPEVAKVIIPDVMAVKPPSQALDVSQGLEKAINNTAVFEAPVTTESAVPMPLQVKSSAVIDSQADISEPLPIANKIPQKSSISLKGETEDLTLPNSSMLGRPQQVGLPDSVVLSTKPASIAVVPPEISGQKMESPLIEQPQLQRLGQDESENDQPQTPQLQQWLETDESSSLEQVIVPQSEESAQAETTNISPVPAPQVDEFLRVAPLVMKKDFTSTQAMSNVAAANVELAYNEGEIAQEYIIQPLKGDEEGVRNLVPSKTVPQAMASPVQNHTQAVQEKTQTIVKPRYGDSNQLKAQPNLPVAHSLKATKLPPKMERYNVADLKPLSERLAEKTQTQTEPLSNQVVTTIMPEQAALLLATELSEEGKHFTRPNHAGFGQELSVGDIIDVPKDVAIIDAESANHVLETIDQSAAASSPIIASPPIQIVKVTDKATPLNGGSAPIAMPSKTQSILAALPSNLQSNKSFPEVTPFAISRLNVKSLEIESPKVSTHEALGISIAVKKERVDVSDYLGKAFSAMQEGNLQEAGGYYEAVLEVEPNNIDALSAMATLYHRGGEKAKARDFYKRVLSIAPDEETALNNFLILVSEESPEGAVKELLKLEARNPQYAAIPAQLSNVYASQGQLKKALDKAILAVSLDQDNLDYRYSLAVLLEHLGYKKEAISSYRVLKNSMQKGGIAAVNLSFVQERLTFLLSNSAS